MIITASRERRVPASERSAGAVLFRKEAGRTHYLLLHYEEGHWGSSKGHVENGETMLETAAREVGEETGLTGIRFLDGFKEEIAYFFQAENKLVHKSVTFLLAEAPAGGVRLSSEHTQYLWLPFPQALDMTTFADEKAVLQKAHSFLTRHAL